MVSLGAVSDFKSNMLRSKSVLIQSKIFQKVLIALEVLNEPFLLLGTIDLIFKVDHHFKNNYTYDIFSPPST